MANTVPFGRSTAGPISPGGVYVGHPDAVIGGSVVGECRSCRLLPELTHTPFVEPVRRKRSAAGALAMSSVKMLPSGSSVQPSSALMVSFLPLAETMDHANV